MHVRIVELSVDLPRFNLGQGYLFLDVIEYHQEVLAFLCISGVVVSHRNDRTVVFHDNGGELERYLQFLTESDKKVEFFCEGEDGPSFCVCR